jgi:cytochrome c-type biogenesis protein CcmH/NrfF
VLLFALLVATVARGDSAGKPTLESLGNEVQCTCGCVAPLNQCPHLDCAEKAGMQALIKSEIAGGKSETTILQDLSLRYGVQVLSSPPAKGFNLSVWLLPGVGLLIGLGVVVVIVRRWRSKPAEVTVPSAISHDAKLVSAVEEEIKSAGLEAK